jgi:serine/threonine protein kinase
MAGISEATATLAADFETNPGLIVGTISHMSPEQARGEEVDARSDIFSFGVVLYELATGRLPFQGSTSALIFDAILNRAPEPPLQLNPELPGKLGDIIERCLEKGSEGPISNCRRSRRRPATSPAEPLLRLVCPGGPTSPSNSHPIPVGGSRARSLHCCHSPILDVPPAAAGACAAAVAPNSEFLGARDFFRSVFP